jgi:hypothetical protein
MESRIKFIKGAMWGLMVITVVLFSSCSKTTSVTPDYSSLLPQTAKNFWEYAIHDSVGNFYDTVLVTIEGTTTLPSGQTASIWRYHYHYKGYSDTTYVVLQGATVLVYINAAPHNTSPNYVEYQRFTLPVSAGQSTTVNGDTLTVIGQGGINVPAGNFDPCYEFSHNTSNSGSHISETIVYYNGIGIIRFSHSEDTNHPFLEQGVYYLLKYNVDTK